jgi:hypothetical protein
VCPHPHIGFPDKSKIYFTRLLFHLLSSSLSSHLRP